MVIHCCWFHWATFYILKNVCTSKILTGDPSQLTVVRFENGLGLRGISDNEAPCGLEGELGESTLTG